MGDREATVMLRYSLEFQAEKNKRGAEMGRR